MVLPMFCIGSLDQEEPMYKLLWPVFVILFHSKVRIPICEQQNEYNLSWTG